MMITFLLHISQNNKIYLGDNYSIYYIYKKNLDGKK